MDFDYNVIVDKLLDMNPDTIPKFVLLKEFKGYKKGNSEYNALYEKICNHPFLKSSKKAKMNKDFGILFMVCPKKPLGFYFRMVLTKTIYYWQKYYHASPIYYKGKKPQGNMKNKTILCGIRLCLNRLYLPQ